MIWLVVDGISSVFVSLSLKGLDNNVEAVT